MCCAAAMKDGVYLRDTSDLHSDCKGKRIGGYMLGRTIGEGSFAKVKEAVHVQTNQRVAVKIVDKTTLKGSEYLQRNFRREAEVLQRIRHPNVAKLYEVVETEQNYYLIMELATGGELMSYICGSNKLTEDESRKFLRQIIVAVDYLHKAGVVHRDLKVENVLLDDQKNIKIIDFGLSNTLGEGDLLLTQCGSPAYTAPEVFCQKGYGPAVDIWSIGINMYAMLTGELPFHVEPTNMTVLHAQILCGAKIPDTLSDDCKDLLSKLLQQNAEKRIKMEDIMTHAWINEGHLYDPLEASPFPAFKTADQLNDAILTRMTDSMGYIKEDIISSVCQNKASAATATYCLMEKMLKNASIKRSRSYAPKLSVSDSQVNVRSLMTTTNRHADDDRSLISEASSSFKEVIKEMKQEESKRQTKLRPSHRQVSRSPNRLMARRSSTDSKINRINTQEQEEITGERTRMQRRQSHNDSLFPKQNLEVVYRRASINSIADGGRRLSKRSGGLQLTVTSPTKSSKMPVSRNPALNMKWGPNTTHNRPSSLTTHRSLQKRRSVSDSILDQSRTEAGTETYRRLVDVISPVTEEEPTKLPNIGSSFLMGFASARTAGAARLARKFAQEQTKL